MKPRLLLIEDDPSAGPALQKVLRAEGYQVELVTRGDTGLARAAQEEFQLVLTDFKLPGLGGLDLISQLHASRPRLPIIMMTAHGTTETAIEATKLGACEYLTKPFEADELIARVAEAVRASQLMSEPVQLGADTPSPHALIGSSRAMQSVFKEIGRIAATPVTVLIRGATGTGKELVARAIYHHSDRAHQPFIAVNCAAIPHNLLESELFGHERGAFTGAHSRRIGRFEQASGGTLFLDEIGDLPAEAQAKLLRVLQERQLQRVGGDVTIPVDVRLIAATHRDLEAAIADREFREDLFYRLSVVTIRLPDLSERREDVPALVRHFFQRHARDLGIDSPSLLPETITLLQEQSWPGNVRELENVVRQALLLARPFPVGPDQVRQALARSHRPAAPLRDSHSAYVADLLARTQAGQVENAYWKMIEELEPELFSQAIRLAGGNQVRAARWLGITRLKLREKLATLGLSPRDPDSP